MATGTLLLAGVPARGATTTGVLLPGGWTSTAVDTWLGATEAWGDDTAAADRANTAAAG